MRIVLIGISHWHTPFYSGPVLPAAAQGEWRIPDTITNLNRTPQG
jgi:hypothetical protein